MIIYKCLALMNIVQIFSLASELLVRWVVNMSSEVGSTFKP